MKRIIILALLATICYTSFAQTREEFEAAIIDMNSQMPISMGPSGEAQSVAIEGQYVVYDIVVNDLGNTMSKGVLTPEKYKDTFLTFLPVSIMSTQYLSDFFSAMIEFNMGIIFHVTSENTGDVISVTISSQELNESINSQPNFKKVLDIAVMNLCRSMNSPVGVLFDFYFYAARKNCRVNDFIHPGLSGRRVADAVGQDK